MNENKVFVGCCMVVFNKKMDKVLLSKRKKEPDLDGWQIPGGTVDYSVGENVLEAAQREASEETGIVIQNAKFLCVMNTFYYGKERPLHIGFYTIAESDEIPPNPEPHKSEDWQWVSLKNLPDGKWFKMSKIALNFAAEIKDFNSLENFYIDSEYKNLK